jgi:hypothetical protein
MSNLQTVKWNRWLPVGIGLSGLYGLVAAVLLFAASWGKDGFAWSIFGGGLAAALLPIAIVWAIAGFVTQFYQLQLQREQLREQGEVLREQANELKETRTVLVDQLGIQNRLAEEAARQNELAAQQNELATQQNVLRDKAIMANAIPGYLQYLDDLAREIKAANRGEGAADKRAIHNLIDYLDFLDFYHGTKEKQELIQALDDNPNFIRFWKELHWFEVAAESVHLTFMIDRSYQIDRLKTNLERFETYPRVVARSRSSS